MKTILRIIMILLVASVVAGAFSFVLNNSSSTSGSNNGIQPSAMTGSNSQFATQPMARPEGGEREGGSLVGVLGTLAKITGITLLVIGIQKGLRLIENRKLSSAHQ